MNMFSNLFKSKAVEKTEHKAAMEYPPPAEGSILFNVGGAGSIALGNNPHSHTAQSYGFSFGVSWGRYGYRGGVLGREEAVRMAKYILEKCEGLPSEMDEYTQKHDGKTPKEVRKELDSFFESRK